MGRNTAARGLLVAVCLVWAALSSPALALSWQKSSGLPAFTLAEGDYGNACLGCSPREGAVSFSRDGSVGLLTLPLQDNPAVYRTLDGGRTWSKVTDSAFFGVWVLTNTRWLAVGQLSSSPSTPYNPRVGNQLLVGGPDGSGAVRWSTLVAKPDILDSAAYRFSVAPFDGGAFVLGDVLYPSPDTPGNRLTALDRNNNAVQAVWRYDVASNTLTPVFTNTWSQLFPSLGSPSTRNRTPFIQRIGAASRNVAWAAWQGFRDGRSFDGQVTAWDGARWATIREAQEGVSTLQLVGLAANQLWVARANGVLYFNGQGWTQLGDTPVGSRANRWSLPASPTLSSIVAVNTYTEFKDNQPEVVDNMWRWDAARQLFPYFGYTERAKASLFGGWSSLISAASSGDIVLVYTRESATDWGARTAVVKSQTWAPGQQPVQLPSVTCIIDDAANASTDKPCNVFALVALPSGAVLLSKDGVFHLA